MVVLTCITYHPIRSSNEAICWTSECCWSEVRKLNSTIVGQQDITSFNITMYFTQRMKVRQAQQSPLTDSSNLIFFQRLLVHFNNVRCWSQTIFHNEPCRVFFQKTCLVFDRVLMLDYVQELDFLDDILPFLQIPSPKLVITPQSLRKITEPNTRLIVIAIYVWPRLLAFPCTTSS